jgi:hypothetical protein
VEPERTKTDELSAYAWKSLGTKGAEARVPQEEMENDFELDGPELNSEMPLTNDGAVHATGDEITQECDAVQQGTAGLSLNACEPVYTVVHGTCDGVA